MDLVLYFMEVMKSTKELGNEVRVKMSGSRRTSPAENGALPALQAQRPLSQEQVRKI